MRVNKSLTISDNNTYRGEFATFEAASVFADELAAETGKRYFVIHEHGSPGKGWTFKVLTDSEYSAWLTENVETVEIPVAVHRTYP